MELGEWGENPEEEKPATGMYKAAAPLYGAAAGVAV
jgi:hypothetical protein